MTPLSDVKVPISISLWLFISYHFWDIQHYIMVWPWKLGYVLMFVIIFML